MPRAGFLGSLLADSINQLAKNPNPKQLELAKSVGMEIPAGYTYVKAYEHPGGKGERRLYRSRSALTTLFGAS